MTTFLLTAVFRLIGVVATVAVVLIVVMIPNRSGWDAVFAVLALVLGILEALFGLFVEVSEPAA